MRGVITRAGAIALAGTFVVSATATPCAAAEKGGLPQQEKTSLTNVSPATQALLTASRPARVAQQSADAPSRPGGFFRSKRGAVALTLMAAGAGFTLWSVNHDRKPVKSPVR